MSGQSYTINSVEYAFQCNYQQTITNILKTQAPCSANFQCENTQCCAPRVTSMKINATANAPENYPTQSYCIDKTKVGQQPWADWNTDLGFDSEGYVSAQCMPDPNFVPLNTLSFFANEVHEDHGEIENYTTTVVYDFKEDADKNYLYLYDEEQKQKKFIPL